MRDHKRRHGGQAAQAKRRGEEWIMCIDCTDHRFPQAFRADDPPPAESPWRILGLVVFMLGLYAVLIYALPVVLIGLFGGAS